MIRVYPLQPSRRILPPVAVYFVFTYFDYQPSYGIGRHVGIGSAFDEMRRRIDGGHVDHFQLQEYES